MNSLVEPVETYLDGTVSVVRLDADLSDHNHLVTQVDEAGMTLSDLFPDLQAGLPDPALGMHPTIRHDQREALRDPVSIEYVLHFDGSCVPTRPDATLVVAREVAAEAPPTRFVSTIGFLSLARELGVFDNIDPNQVDAVFGYSAFYSRVHQLWLDLEPQDERMQEVIRNDLSRDNVLTRQELIDKLDTDPLRHKRTFPLVSQHSITGQDCIMIDAGARNIGLQPKEGAEVDGEELQHVFNWLQLLLADDRRLRGEGIVAEVTPATGYGVAFPKEGLHNQVPYATQEARTAMRQMSILGLVAKS